MQGLNIHTTQTKRLARVSSLPIPRFLVRRHPSPSFNFVPKTFPGPKLGRFSHHHSKIRHNMAKSTPFHFIEPKKTPHYQ
ncbi:cytosolic sulfotransferase 12 [Phtheirospermum japonicum]|uniref:Cytosolic sulfotransferase 12 n=1 Tax=Phtheirospermum japonicum TaxID=374723 RepID=A0A830BTF7_9LAMI|nr:cytosolic sulfotransferase 12 [Phtheirospermum japonicum]